jgi:hypothetical protein
MLNICDTIENPIESSLNCDIRYCNNFDFIGKRFDRCVIFQFLALLWTSNRSTDTVSGFERSNENRKANVASCACNLSHYY